MEAKFFETMKGQEVRAESLQRILHVVFQTSLLERPNGTWLNLSGGGCVRVSPRALLYVCDEPEERTVMCLKVSGCLFPCTECTVGRDSSCTVAGTNDPRRNVHETVRAQLHNVLMSDLRGTGAMRDEAKMAHSLKAWFLLWLQGRGLATALACIVACQGLTASMYLSMLNRLAFCRYFPVCEFSVLPLRPVEDRPLVLVSVH